MATAKLPCNISILEKELKECINSITENLKLFSLFLENLSSNQDKYYAQQDKKWILLIGNYAAQNFVHQRFLEELGCEVEVVKDIHAALERIDRGFDYIFCAGTSHKETLEFAKLVHLREQKQRPRLVALSDIADKDFKTQCLATGIQEVITAPLSYPSLKALLTQRQQEEEMEGC